MVWTIELTDEALKNLKKMNRSDAANIISYLRNRLATAEDPTVFGRPLRGHLSGKYRFRIGDYRVICRIEKDVIRILVLRIGHRRDVYKGR